MSVVIACMKSITTELNIIFELEQWELFVRHLIFLWDEFHSREVKIADCFIDLRKVSPVPRSHVTRICFHKYTYKVVVHHATLFSLTNDEVTISPLELRKDIEFLFEDFVTK